MSPERNAATLDAERVRAFLHLAARRVTAEVKREWHRDPAGFGAELGIGADGTPTKRVDQVAEDVILETLTESGLRLNVLSEECGEIDNGATHTLVMDPIDGTRNATHDIPFYCVSLAIGARSVGDVEYALVRNISTEDTFFARRGHGASLNGEPVRVRPFRPDEILVAALYDENDDLQKYWSIPNIHLRDMGSSALEIALIASGSFDAFVSHIEFLRVTDIAAAALILREAGGEIYTGAGGRLDTPFHLGARTSVVAVSDRRLLEVLR